MPPGSGIAAQTGQLKSIAFALLLSSHYRFNPRLLHHAVSSISAWKI